ncbi:MAG: PEPxxWA-CTERM sorting domain-containing protein [Phenylobacterium sp.]|uniref:PEPxxWA-CTERM sorting domain-containing protein n=1 Tax=Phenylobacterium sp. TaxID=1871053 RepID=UPI001A3D04BE|nr:PEPxxWA-CTERM sorting domain-containing protein [Phenylobacterium sp.]MBL8554380.1 PEPxxWA-CTERM sorting domain-containing protein [Phenylobacterium sp.]
MTLRTTFAAAAVALTLPLAAQAAAVYDNDVQRVDPIGACTFNTTCGDIQVAQKFTLASAATLKSASFWTFNDPLENNGGQANWAFYQADGDGGQPGTLITSGTSGPVDLTTDSGGWLGNFDLVLNAFDLPSVSLGAGSYYFGLRYDTSVFTTYLAMGEDNTGAFRSNDGGASWTPSYAENVVHGVAVALYDTPVGGAVPEPGAWALMILGFGAAGAALRRRRIAMA